MGLLQPEAGLLFWMTLAFAVVFVLLARYGFPTILRAIDSRKEYIDSSLDAAREAERRLEGIRAESDRMRDEAEKQRAEILREAAETRERLVREAKAKAEEEGARLPRPNARRSCRMPAARWRSSRWPSPSGCCASGSATKRRRRVWPNACSTRCSDANNKPEPKPCTSDR